MSRWFNFKWTKYFDELDDSFLDFSLEDQQKFSSQVNEYIQGLPEEEQNQIKEKLEIDDLTDDIVLTSIVTNGTSKVFTIIAKVNGFFIKRHLILTTVPVCWSDNAVGYWTT